MGPIIYGQKLATLEANERREEIVIAVEKIRFLSGKASQPVYQCREGAKHRASKYPRFTCHQLGEQDLHDVVVARQLRYQLAHVGALTQIAIQKDHVTEVFLYRAEELIVR